jgi:hypothetical protein
MACWLAPAEHFVPQAPQLLTSDCVSTQCPLHMVPLQLVVPVQRPETQLAPPEQTLPQEPQLCSSLLVSTQLSSQAV